MSAWICMPEHFGLLAAFAVRRHCATIFTPDSRAVSARLIAQELARECIRSVAARYPNDVDGGRPGVQMLDADIIKEAGAFAEYYRDHWPEGQTDSHINCHARSCRYQSWLCSDFATTAASRQLEAILFETRDAPPLPAVPFVWGFEDEMREILDDGNAVMPVPEQYRQFATEWPMEAAELERLREENLRLRGLAQLTLDDIEAFDAQCNAEHYTDTEEAWIIMGKLAALARTLLADPQPAKVPA